MHYPDGVFEFLSVNFKVKKKVLAVQVDRNIKIVSLNEMVISCKI